MHEAKHPLRLVHPASPGEGRFEVRCRLEASGSKLIASFEVETPSSPYVNPALSTSSSQWGLWDWDVVELFVATSERGYYEFQVSPLGQFFELRIHEPRKSFNRQYRSSGRFTAQARGAPLATAPVTGAWSGRIEIPASAIEWDGDVTKLKGGAFAILGRPEQRTYWSAFLPSQEIPDFHLPEQFRPLFY